MFMPNSPNPPRGMAQREGLLKRVSQPFKQPGMVSQRGRRDAVGDERDAVGQIPLPRGVKDPARFPRGRKRDN
jgi:hypothetical protein